MVYKKGGKAVRKAEVKMIWIGYVSWLKQLETANTNAYPDLGIKIHNDFNIFYNVLSINVAALKDLSCFVSITDKRVQKGYTEMSVSADFAGIKREIKKQAALWTRAACCSVMGISPERGVP